MVVFRCTQRLAKRFRLSLVREPSESTGLLGDWFATLLNVGNTRLVLCLSERALLPVLVPARQAEFPSHFSGHLFVVLKHIGIPRGTSELEVLAAENATFAPTRSRQILGSLNDFGFHARAYLESGDSPLHACLRLAEMPSKAIDFVP